jgi:hypothetical protein
VPGPGRTARSRTTWAAVALGALFVAMVAWAFLSVQAPESAARATHERDSRVLRFTPGEVQDVAIAPRSAPGVRLARTARGWRLLAPAEGPASALAVEGFLDRLAEMRVRATVPSEPGTAASRGLDPPAARLTLTLRDGTTLALDLGDESPFDRTRFGRSGGEIRVIEGVPAAALDPVPGAFQAGSGAP